MTGMVGKIKRGAFWAGLSTVLVYILSLLARLLLMAIIAREDFGLIATASLALDALVLFQEMGFGSALIYRKAEVEDAADTAFYLLLLTGIVTYLVAFFSAPAISHIASKPDPRIIPVVRVLSLSIIFSAFARVPVVMLSREMDFRRKAATDVIPTLSNVVVSVLLALAGWGVWSIVYGRLTSALMRVVVSWWITGWRPRLIFIPKIAGELFAYGKFIFQSQILIFLITNIDDFFVIHLLGYWEEGAYDAAYRLSNLPTTFITKTAGQVMFPAMARLRDDKAEFRRVFFRSTHYIALASIPLSFALVLLAPSLMGMVGPKKWADAVLPMQLLVVYGMMRSIAANMGSVFKGGGKPQWLTYIALWRLATMAAFLYPATSRYGIVGVSALSAIVSVVDFFISGELANRVMDASWAEYLPVVGPIFVWSAAAAGVAWLVQTAVSASSPAISFLVGGTVLTVVYVPLAVLGDEPLRRQARSLWKMTLEQIQ